MIYIQMPNTMMKTTFKKIKLFILPVCLVAISMAWSQSEANYDISLTTIWNSTDHTSVPGNAHWSPLIGATHNTANEFVEIGALATTGIKDIAEGGVNTAFTSEINTAIAASRADQLLQDGFSPFAGNNSVGEFTSVTISEDFPLITLVSMVAPSPDWFIAINSLDMRSGNPAINNGWKETFTMDVFAYDSGTDDGINYTSGNATSNPFVPVFMVAGAPINGNRMATITFTYNSSTLGIDDIESIKRVKVFPNPATDVLTITNTFNSVDSAELYNVLGKRVYIKTAITNTDLKMNVQKLQRGIYILKLKNKNGDTASRKVIIE